VRSSIKIIAILVVVCAATSMLTLPLWWPIRGVCGNWLLEDIKIHSVTLNQANNSLLVNCTLFDGSKESTTCNLKQLIIRNFNGTPVATGIPAPCTLYLNEPTIVTLNLTIPLPSEIYTIEVLTSNKFTFTSSLNVGNFTDPQQKIEVKNLHYNNLTRSIILTCCKIEDRTQLFVYILDDSGYLIDTDWHPVRTQIPQNNETSVKVVLTDSLNAGQYSLTISTPRGVTTHFTVP